MFSIDNSCYLVHLNGVMAPKLPFGPYLVLQWPCPWTCETQNLINSFSYHSWYFHPICRNSLHAFWSGQNDGLILKTCEPFSVDSALFAGLKPCTCTWKSPFVIIMQDPWMHDQSLARMFTCFNLRVTLSSCLPKVFRLEKCFLLYKRGWWEKSLHLFH